MIIALMGRSSESRTDAVGTNASSLFHGIIEKMT
jgi:hypothetical protein